MTNEADKVAQHVADVLKEHGFRKKHRTWHRGANGVIQVLNLQASQWNQHDFYCNLALYLTDLGDLASPPEYKCHIRRRTDTADIPGMIRFALAWFDERKTVTGIRERFHSGDLDAIVTGEAQSFLRGDS